MSLRRLVLAVLLALSEASCARAQTPQDDLVFEPEFVLEVNGERLALGQPEPLWPFTALQGVLLSRDYQAPGDTKWMRVHLSIESGLEPRIWQVRVLDNVENMVSTWTPRADQSGYWSGRIDGGKATIQILADHPGAKVHLRIDKVALSGRVFIPQGITTKREDIKKIGDEDGDVKKWGRAVVQISFISDKVGPADCTGFLLSERILITNNHCLSNKDEAESAELRFDFDSPDDSNAVRDRVEALLYSNYPLDFSLVKLETPHPSRHIRIDPGLLPTQELLIIEHPEGQFKQVSRTNCLLKAANVRGRGAMVTDFSHVCNTLGGSSGSPVLNRTSGAIVGLHHLGFDKKTNSFENRAVTFSTILEKIASCKPDLAREIGLKPSFSRCIEK